MKKLYVILVMTSVFFFSATLNNSFAQTWTAQTSGTTSGLNSVSFTDVNNGTVVGADMSGGIILRTTNGGTTWTVQNETDLGLYSVSFTDANNGTTVGDGFTILRTTNGGTNWTSQTSEITFGWLMGVSFTDVNNGTAVGYESRSGFGAIIRTINGGTNWTSQSSGTLSQLNSVSFTDSDNGTAVGAGGTILRTTNGGTNWTSQTSGTSSQLYSVSFTDVNNGTAVGEGGTILRTTNGGTNWTSQTGGSGALTSVSFTDVNNGTAISADGKILRTTNGGTNWTVQTSLTGKSFYGVSFTDANNGTVVGYDENGHGLILRTTDGALPVELTSFTALAGDGKVELNWETATETNNYGFEVQRQKSEDRNQKSEWEKIGFVNGAGNSNSPKEYSYTDYSVSSGSYSYRLKQLDNDGKYEYSKEVEIDLRIPVEFSLHQNYPNPFNPETIISYQLPVSGNTSLKVFNILGSEVATLVNEVQEAGTYDVSFNGKDLTSGIYFFRLQSGDFVKINKMTLMK